MENRTAVLWRTVISIWHILAFYGTLIKFNQIWAIFGALGSHDNRIVFLQDLTQKSCGSPENMRFSMRTYFMEHHSANFLAFSFAQGDHCTIHLVPQVMLFLVCSVCCNLQSYQGSIYRPEMHRNICN